MDQTLETDPVKVKPEVPDSLAPEAARARMQLYLQMLKALAMMGMDLTQSICAHTLAQYNFAADGWTADLSGSPGAAVVRLSQSVRRTIALDIHLRERLVTDEDDPWFGCVKAKAPATRSGDSARRQPPTPEKADNGDRETGETSGRAVFNSELRDSFDRPESFIVDPSPEGEDEAVAAIVPVVHQGAMDYSYGPVLPWQARLDPAASGVAVWQGAGTAGKPTVLVRETGPPG